MPDSKLEWHQPNGLKRRYPCTWLTTMFMLIAGTCTGISPVVRWQAMFVRPNDFLLWIKRTFWVRTLILFRQQHLEYLDTFFWGKYFQYGSCECIVLRVKAWAKSQHRCGWCVKSIALHWTHLQICTKMSIIKIGSAFIRQFPFISRTIRSVVSLRVLYFI